MVRRYMDQGGQSALLLAMGVTGIGGAYYGCNTKSPREIPWGFLCFGGLTPHPLSVILLPYGNELDKFSTNEVQ